MTHKENQGEHLAWKERRGSPRYAIGVVQQIAEMPDGATPPLENFKRFQIIDVSREGFCYYTLSAPKVANLAVVLGEPPDLECMMAEVVYVRKQIDCGHELLRVGCRLTGTALIDIEKLLHRERVLFEAMKRQMAGLS